MLLNMFCDPSLMQNDKCDRTFVERVVVRVIQFDNNSVRARRNMLRDDRIRTRVGPHPGRIVKAHMNVSDARLFRSGIFLWSARGRPLVCSYFCCGAGIMNSTTVLQPAIGL